MFLQTMIPFLQIIKSFGYTKKHTNQCAAQLLQFIYNRCKWYEKNRPWDYVWISLKRMREGLEEQYSIGTIRNALKILLDRGVVEQVTPETSYNNCSTYRIVLPKYQEWLDYVEPPKETAPKSTVTVTDKQFVKFDKRSEEFDKRHEEFDNNIDLIPYSISNLTTSPPTPPEGEREEEKYFSSNEETAIDRSSQSPLTQPVVEIQSDSDDRLPASSIVVVKKDYKDPYWSRRGKNLQERLNPANNLAVGEWTVDGKLDPKFHDWLANKWLNQFGERYKGDRFAARADVLAHFYNQPEKLPIRWMQYSEEYSYRYQQTKEVVDAGIKVDEEYQQRLVENVRAVAVPLSEENSPCAGSGAGAGAQRRTRDVRRTDIRESSAAFGIAGSGDSGWRENIPEAGADNAAAYKEWTSPKDSEKLDSEQVKSLWAEAKAKVANAMAMPKAVVAREKKSEFDSPLGRSERQSGKN